MNEVAAIAIASGVLLLAAVVEAQVPGFINYQGRIVDNGTNFTGTGQFEFALINGTSGTTNYWANDGTAAGQPRLAVPLPVTKGLYSVLLGDTTISNMTVAIPATVFTNADVRLRVWFNDGVSGFQQLTPDQRLAAVGYAMMAASVPAGAIGSAQLASNAVTAAAIASGAVTAAAIAPGAVTAAAIANGAVGSSQLASNAISAANLVAPLATQGMLAQGASIIRGANVLYYGTNLFGWSAAITNNDQACLVGGSYSVTNFTLVLAGLTNVTVIGVSNPRVYNYVPTTNPLNYASVTLKMDASTNCTANGLAFTTTYGPNYPPNIDACLVTAGAYAYNTLIENCDFFSLMAVPTWDGQGGVFVAVNSTNLVLENVTIGSLGMSNHAATAQFYPGCGWLATHGYNTNFAFRNVTLYGMAEEVEPTCCAVDSFFTQSRAPDLGECLQPLGACWSVGNAFYQQPYFGNLTDYENHALIYAATGLWVLFPITTNNTPYPAANDVNNAFATGSNPSFSGTLSAQRITTTSYINSPTGGVAVGGLSIHSMVINASNVPSALSELAIGQDTNGVFLVDTGSGSFTGTLSMVVPLANAEVYVIKVSPDTNVFTLDSGTLTRGIGKQGEQIMFTNQDACLLLHAARLTNYNGSNYWVILSNNMGLH
jgi:hypothetical protein